MNNIFVCSRLNLGLICACLSLACIALCFAVDLLIPSPLITSPRDSTDKHFSSAEPNVEKVPSSQSESVEGGSQSLGRLKEEVTGKDGASVKTEVRTCPFSP